MSHFLKTNYYLRDPDPKKDRLTAIYMSATCDGERSILFPSVSIHPKNWDNKKFKPKPCADTTAIKGRLEEFEEHVRKTHADLQKQIGGIVPAEILKKAVYGQMPPTVKPAKAALPKTVSVIEFFQKFVDDSRNGTRLSPHDTKIKEQSINPYISTKGHFAEFQKRQKKVYTLADIDQNVVNLFHKYLVSCKRTDDLPLSLNAVGKYMQVFKTMLQYALQNKLISPTFMVEVKVKARREKSDNIFLDESELLEMMNIKGLTGLREKVRNLFIIQSYTGLRWSDFSKLGKQNIHDNHIEYIESVQNKTHGKVTIPVHQNVKKIFEKYNYKLPNFPPSQKYNDELKEIGKLLPSLSQSFTKRTTRAGVKQVVESPRHELVTSHTARRSFCSNLYLRGVDTEVIMALSGHESEKSFRIYIAEAIRRKRAEAANNNWYEDNSSGK